MASDEWLATEDGWCMSPRSGWIGSYSQNGLLPGYGGLALDICDSLNARHDVFPVPVQILFVLFIFAVWCLALVVAHMVPTPAQGT